MTEIFFFFFFANERYYLYFFFFFFFATERSLLDLFYLQHNPKWGHSAETGVRVCILGPYALIIETEFH